MSKINERHQLLTRRIFVLGALKLSAIAALLGRLYQLQFVKTKTYQTQAEDNRVSLQLIPPPRGLILDRNQLPMAENQIYYRVVLERGDLEATLKVLARMAEILQLSDAHRGRLEQELRGLWKGRIITVKEHLSWDELSAIEFNAPDLPGMMIESGQVRYYPLADRASHLIGYVGAVSENELDEGQPVLKLPGFKIGKNGVEKQFEQSLRGKAGLRHMEVNVKGLMVRELERREPVPGEDLKMTVDLALQDYCARRLSTESGAIVVMEAETGNVLSLVSMPAFDPNTFSVGITRTYWAELQGNNKNPLLNKALAGQYPPGSTFKMIMAMAALEEHLITPQSRIFCPGHFFLGNHQFNCWKPGGHGAVDVVNALAESCDTFFYHMAQKLGAEKIAAMMHRFGLGETLGIEVPGEKTGIAPTPEWKRQRYNQPWHPGDTISVGIGQGYVLATPLQLATMSARLATGKAVAPRVDSRRPREEFALLDVNPENLETVREGMNAVVNAPNGTAYARRLIGTELSMAGKTGTSQVRKITVRGQDQNSIPWENRHHALFTAYGPVDVPKYAACVIVEHGGGGSSAAAPVAKDVFLKLNELYYGGPPAPEPLPPEEGAS